MTEREHQSLKPEDMGITDREHGVVGGLNPKEVADSIDGMLKDLKEDSKKQRSEEKDQGQGPAVGLETGEKENR